MADPALHIKDAYFFEVPKFPFPRSYTKPSEFPSVWLKLDPTVQLAEAELLAAEYPVGEKSAEQSVQAWQDWSPKHHHAPYDVYYEEEQSTETEHKEIPASFRKSVQQEVLGDTKWLDGEVADKWSEHGLLAKYNKHLSGKIIIPQPFGGELRNLHEAESGFCVSKFMLVELVVVSVVVLLFARLGKSISGGKAAK